LSGAGPSGYSTRTSSGCGRCQGRGDCGEWGDSKGEARKKSRRRGKESITCNFVTVSGNRMLVTVVIMVIYIFVIYIFFEFMF
jgi:hypothetical protein